jgi:membrane protein DedA with SNARE-associated domain
LAALISVPIWVYLGYYGAKNHEWLMTWLGRGQVAILLLVAVVVVVVGVWYWRNRKEK